MKPLSEAEKKKLLAPDSSSDEEKGSGSGSEGECYQMPSPPTVNAELYELLHEKIDVKESVQASDFITDEYSEILDKRRLDHNNFRQSKKRKLEASGSTDLFRVVYYDSRDAPPHTILLRLKHFPSAMEFFDMMKRRFKSELNITYSLEEGGPLNEFSRDMSDKSWKSFSPFEIRVRKA
ncbi:hypothetical protein ACHQM5_017831 [Ranunculus cassubicifolius]